MNLESLQSKDIQDKTEPITALVIIDHGSKLGEANNMLISVCNEFKSRFPKFTIVEPAHMEMAEPSIRNACINCVAQGATKILCHPFFLARGKHVRDDIPRLVNEVKVEFPHIDISVTPHLGSNSDIVNNVYSVICSS